MPGGSVAVIGARNAGCSFNALGSCDRTETPLLGILNAAGTQTATLAASALGGGNSVIAGAAIDAGGNLWITGETDSDDFPLVNPLFTQKADYKPTGFAAKLDPKMNILFSTFIIGGPVTGLTNATAIALDGSGNACVAGVTGDSGFPTTAPVFAAGAPVSSLGFHYYTFVIKISRGGGVRCLAPLHRSGRTF
jgi:hypothetical protein